ncbi:hypothetical protein [Stackebrandtia albiflava]|uniref:hypothetical protein n=1 Tax=Stackebrandtia albiflava TaxID=406432 RepID=UPI001FCEE7DC|nr:hypothetical protein [Stackebrandtia albiflava]
MTITRFHSDAASEELVARHTALVEATRAVNPGLASTWLGRASDDAWVGVWRWEDAAALDAARRNPPAEAPAVFGLATTTPTVEEVTITDLR